MAEGGATDELILGRYRPLGEAGAGGYGTVFVAFDERIKRRVAVKRIQLDAPVAPASVAPSVAAPSGEEAPPWDPSWSGRDIPGLEEARTAALLEHPNIVGIIDFEVRDDAAYLIMEYVDGLTLTQLIEDWGAYVDADIVAAVCAGAAAALGYAHENGVLHLDVKPDNIMINRQGNVKMTDFGLANLSEAGGNGAAVGGTIGYMPPEQMARQRLDARCDEWALASTLYEMIAGENPFWARNLDEAQTVIFEAELVLPSLCMPGLDEEVDDVLFYALDPDRTERYATVADFAEELQPLLGDVAAGTEKLKEIAESAADDSGGEVEGMLAPASREFSRGWDVRALVLRAVSGAGAGVLAFVGLANMPLLGGVTDPALWGICAAVVLFAVLVPHVGAVAAAAALVVACVCQGALLPAVLLGAATIAWWAYAGRRGLEAPAAALAGVPLGAVGLADAAPVAAGTLLPVRDALATAAYSALVAVLLAGLGSANLHGWNALAYWFHLGPGYQQTLGITLSDPFTWATIAVWLIAAVVAGWLGDRGHKVLAIIGIVLASALVLVVYLLQMGVIALPAA